MNALSVFLTRACDELGLGIELNPTLALDDGSRVTAFARIPLLGAPNGMLIFRTYSEVRPYVDKLIQAGYGYSILDEPLSSECFDLESFKEMFADWGWCGDVQIKPTWLSS
jgi:hypothetical protein